MIPNDLSFAMYSSRAAATLEEQLSTLSRLGYTDVQPFFFGPPESAQLITDYTALLKKYDLSAKSGHFTLEVFERSPDLVEEIARAFGMGLVVMPWINPEDRPTTAEGWRAIGARLEPLAEDMRRRGLSFAYHNHDFEMIPLPDGSYPLDHLMGERLLLEPDLGWMVVGRADPLVWLEKYAGRIPAVHVKDVAAEGTGLDERGFADIGHGIMDWQALWDASVAAGAQLMIAEHDQPSDWGRFAGRSLEAMKRFGRRS